MVERVVNPPVVTASELLAQYADFYAVFHEVDGRGANGQSIVALVSPTLARGEKRATKLARERGYTAHFAYRVRLLLREEPNRTKLLRFLRLGQHILV